MAYEWFQMCNANVKRWFSIQDSMKKQLHDTSTGYKFKKTTLEASHNYLQTIILE